MAFTKNKIGNITTNYARDYHVWENLIDPQKLWSNMEMILFLFIENFVKLNISWFYVKIRNSR